MDAFKILARGTTLLRPSRQDQKAPRLPSAGASPRPQTISEGLSVVTIEATPSKKRKRRKGFVTEPTQSATSTKSYTSNGTSGKVHEEEEFEGLEEQDEVSETTSASMSEEEIHRVLNQHKLKITWVNTSLHERSGKRAAKDGVHKLRTSKKSGLVRIYPIPLVSFRDLRQRYQLSRRLMENLDGQGFREPTEVQVGSLPILLGDGKDNGLRDASTQAISGSVTIDLLTVAPTGSGKTLAFLIPLIQSILRIRHEDQPAKDKGDCVRGVILAPTHELMDQIVIEGKKLATGTGTRIAAMQKGSYVYQEGNDVSGLAKETSIIKADILVSTPMMLLHSLQDEAGVRSLSSVCYLIFDEADVLLDPLFREQTLAIWTACHHSDLRVSLWSATMGSSIENLTQQFIAERRRKLSLPVRDHYLLRLVVGLKDSSLPSIRHRLVYAGTEQGKLLGLRELLHPSAASTQDQLPPLRAPFLVFTQTIERARALHAELLYDIPVEAGGSSRIAVLHSELSDHARSDIMTRFRCGEVWIIITTDLLSRGIDFRGMNGVVNYDIPTTAAIYVHRAGRTGRAGREGGTAVTLYTREDIPYVKNIANVIAATEKVHGKQTTTDDQGLQKWLLDALPKVGRDLKMELKRRGVASRRTFEPGTRRSKEARRARISTKSGYDREVQNRRKGAIEKSKRLTKAIEDEDDEWNGFEE